MSTVQLGWRLAWAGGRFRGLAVLSGNAIASFLFLLTVALPAAIRPPGPVTSDARLQAVSVLLCLCLPITVLAMSLGRLSASTRDRRLAALRLLGLSPARTRLVAGTENAILAGAGVLLGLAGALAAAPLVTRAVAGHGWLHHPLHLSPAATATACLGLVVLAVVVSLAPTRALHQGSLALRHEGTTTPPSLWRLAPLTVGVAALVGTLLWIRPDSALTGVMVMLGGAGLTGVGVVLALPVAVRAVADLLTRGRSGTSTRLAARRLQIESGAAVRMAAGLTIAAFVITGALGVLTAFKDWPPYQAQHHALTHGPQLDQVFLPDPPSLAPDVDPHQVRQHLLATPGVRAVIADYGIEATSDTCGPANFCGDVFVGTCTQLALLQAVPGCRDDTISLITSETYPQHGLTHPITLTGKHGNQARVQPSPTVLAADKAATQDRQSGTVRYSLFIPTDSPQIAPLAHDPTSYQVVTGPGVTARHAVQTAGDDLGVTVILDDLEYYQAVQGYQLLITTLAVIVLGVGLLAVALTTIDRAIERHRHIAAQVALGVPVRILRGSQLLQTLIPLWLGLIGAIGLGYLTVAAYITLTGVSDTVPTTAILTVGITALAAATIIATITLPGISRHLTPDLLRRE